MAGENFDYAYGDIVDTTLHSTPGGSTPKKIGEAWIAAGIAELPKDEQVLEHQLDVEKTRADDAIAQAQAATQLAEEASTQAVALRAQLATLTEAAGDGADAASKAAELAGKLAVAEKQRDEAVAAMGNVRQTVAAELREQIEADVRATMGSDPAEAEVLVAMEASASKLLAAISEPTA